MYGKAALATWVGSSGRLREMVAGRLRRERASNGERRPDSEKVSALTKGTLKAFATSITTSFTSVRNEADRVEPP
jgi:hypothetical protein